MNEARVSAGVQVWGRLSVTGSGSLLGLASEVISGGLEMQVLRVHPKEIQEIKNLCCVWLGLECVWGGWYLDGNVRVFVCVCMPVGVLGPGCVCVSEGPGPRCLLGRGLNWGVCVCKAPC